MTAVCANRSSAALSMSKELSVGTVGAFGVKSINIVGTAANGDAGIECGGDLYTVHSVASFVRSDLTVDFECIPL